MGNAGEPRVDGVIRWQREFGDPAWYGTVSSPARKAPEPLRLDAIRGPLPEARPMLRRMASPSQEAHGAETGPRKLRSNAGRQFGTRMHDFLATVGWIDFSGPGQLEKLLQEADGDLRDRLARLAGSASGREVFSKPEQPCQLWREKPYLLRNGDRMAMGIIDRAVVYLDKAGRPEHIVIYDYKTDSLDPEKDPMEQLLERYGTQLERYREAVTVLTGLPGDRIETRLIPV